MAAPHFRSPVHYSSYTSPPPEQKPKELPDPSRVTDVVARAHLHQTVMHHHLRDPRLQKGGAGNPMVSRLNPKRRKNIDCEEASEGKRAHTLSPRSFDSLRRPLIELRGIFTDLAKTLSPQSILKKEVKEIESLFLQLLPELPFDQQENFIKELSKLTSTEVETNELSLILGTAAFILSRDRKLPCPLQELPKWRLGEVQRECDQLLQESLPHGRRIPTGASFYLRLTFARTLILPIGRYNPLGFFSLKHLFIHLELEKFSISTEQIKGYFLLIRFFEKQDPDLIFQLKRVSFFRLAPHLYDWVRFVLKLGPHEKVESIHGFWCVATLLFSFLRQEDHHPLCYAISPARAIHETRPATLIFFLLDIFETGVMRFPNPVPFDPKVMCPDGLLNLSKLREKRVTSMRAPSLLRAQRVLKKEDEALDPPKSPVPLCLHLQRRASDEELELLKKTISSYEQDPMEALLTGALAFFTYNSHRLLPSHTLDSVRSWVIKVVKQATGWLPYHQWNRLQILVNSSIFVGYQPLNFEKTKKGLQLSNGETRWLLSQRCTNEDRSFFYSCYAPIILIKDQWHLVQDYTHLGSLLKQLLVDVTQEPLDLHLKNEAIYRSWQSLLRKIEKNALAPTLDYPERIHFSTDGYDIFHLLQTFSTTAHRDYSCEVSNYNHLFKSCCFSLRLFSSVEGLILYERHHYCTAHFALIDHYKMEAKEPVDKYLDKIWKTSCKAFYKKEIPLDLRLNLAEFAELIEGKEGEAFAKVLKDDNHMTYRNLTSQLEASPLSSDERLKMMKRLHYLTYCISLADIETLLLTEFTPEDLAPIIEEMQQHFASLNRLFLPKVAKLLWKICIRATKNFSYPTYESILSQIYKHTQLPPLIPYCDQNYTLNYEEFKKPSICYFSPSFPPQKSTSSTLMLIRINSKSGTFERENYTFPHNIKVLQINPQ
jgi:hypothetical protein